MQRSNKSWSRNIQTTTFGTLMKKEMRYWLAGMLIMSLGGSVCAETIVAGLVSGTWTTTGSPYMVVADIELAFGQTLSIQPGVEIKFTGHYKFLIHGALTAVGTEQDTILFTHATPIDPNYWAGLRFQNTEGISELAFCDIQRGYAQGPVGQAAAKGGAVYVDSANVNIHDCLIRTNKADVKGAGIYLARSDVEIYHNVITGNTSYGDGGGIFLEYCTNPHIYDNIIWWNTSDNGAGLHYVYSGGTLENNFIHHNTANTANGGGIMLDHSSPLMQNNGINNNASTGYFGSGIYCNNASSPVLQHNEICQNGNSGIYCANSSSPNIENNTIYANGSNALRVELSSQPFGRNNIVKENLLGFYVDSGCSIWMTYSDIQGGWSGPGNIDLPPMLANPGSGNFYLLPNSPCIDAGSPNSPLDPDGTIADMGAHYFDQNQPQGTCTLTLTPFGAPIVLPPSGGTVWFGVVVANSPDYYNLFDGWYNLQQPDGQILPMLLRTSLYLPAGGQFGRTLSLTISASAMPGIYTVTGYVGNNPAIIEDFDSFTFEKSATSKVGDTGGMVTITDGDLTETYQLASSLPEQTQLLGHYPEPCNPQATISFALAQTEQVHLEVYSLTGQRVATLVDGELSAGIYRETFEGNNLASGIYLYVLQAGAYRTSGKLTLMK